MRSAQAGGGGAAKGRRVTEAVLQQFHDDPVVHSGVAVHQQVPEARHGLQRGHLLGREA